eukprot:4174201-Pyramimonas_sp.AAC.1
MHLFATLQQSVFLPTPRLSSDYTVPTVVLPKSHLMRTPHGKIWAKHVNVGHHHTHRVGPFWNKVFQIVDGRQVPSQCVNLRSLPREQQSENNPRLRE